MRDINALKRTKTFIENENTNTIRVTKNTLPYYCYVDIFKNYIKNIPYYFGNSDVFINNDSFIELQDIFIKQSCEKHSFIKTEIKTNNENNSTQIDNYFREILGEHYVD